MYCSLSLHFTVAHAALAIRDNRTPQSGLPSPAPLPSERTAQCSGKRADAHLHLKKCGIQEQGISQTALGLSLVHSEG
jgi:hypothetical protein